jgi:hypothetical protein
MIQIENTEQKKKTVNISMRDILSKQQLRNIFYSIGLTIIIMLLSSIVLSQRGNEDYMILTLLGWTIFSISVYFIPKNTVFTLAFNIFCGFMSGMAVAVFIILSRDSFVFDGFTILSIVLLLIVNYLVYRLNEDHLKMSKYLTVATIAVITMLILIVVKFNYFYVAPILFTTIILLMANISIMACLRSRKAFTVNRVINLYSFLQFGAVIIVVITLLTEGSFLEILEEPFYMFAFNKEKKGQPRRKNW